MKSETSNLSHARLLAMDYPTPFMEIDLGIVEQKYHRLKNALGDVQIFYAVKCNPQKEILQTLKEAGCSFEIASAGELDRLIEIGVNPAEVIHSNPVKPRQQIIDTYNKGVMHFAADSREEVEKIAESAPNAKIFVRVSVSNEGSQINLATKFGCSPAEAVEIILLAQNKNLAVEGVAFHVGSQAENIELWDEAFAIITGLLNKLGQHGIKLSTINIGGGYPIMYRQSVPSPAEIAERIKMNIRYHDLHGYKFVTEPGRYLVGEAGVIGATILAKVKRRNTEWLYLDVGRFQAFVELFESEDLLYPVLSLHHAESRIQGELVPYTLTGPSCDSYDTIFKQVILPKDLQEGDKLFFASAGAYTNVYGSNFNDFPVPKVYCVKGS